ncbi:hypothetical protein BMS3Abin06_01401 [bacterium BMS3Abin06]|nr:hypothetical protein BMS3Abin06_01401 [bacterium BMS3Abin06]
MWISRGERGRNFRDRSKKTFAGIKAGQRELIKKIFEGREK